MFRYVTRMKGISYNERGEGREGEMKFRSETRCTRGHDCQIKRKSPAESDVQDLEAGQALG